MSDEAQQQQLSIAELRDIAARQQAHIDEQLHTLRQREAQMTELAGWAAAAAAAAVSSSGGGSGGDPRQRRRHLQQLAASVDAQAERLRRQRSIRQQLAHYRHANAQLGRELAAARAECQARRRRWRLWLPNWMLCTDKRPPLPPLTQRRSLLSSSSRTSVRTLDRCPPLRRCHRRHNQLLNSSSNRRRRRRCSVVDRCRRLLPRRRRRIAVTFRLCLSPLPLPLPLPLPPSLPPHRRLPTELLLSRDRLDDLIRREATAAPNQRDSLVVQDPADEVEAAEAKAEAEAAAAAAAEKSHSESKAPEQPPGSETDSSGEEDPACLTEEPPPPPGERRRRPDDPPGAPTGGWMAPIAKLDDEDDLSLSDYDEAAPVAKGKSSGAPPPTLCLGFSATARRRRTIKAAITTPGTMQKNPAPMATGSGGRVRAAALVTFDPLTLLLDAAIQGDLAQVQRYTGQLGDPSAANSEGISALHNAVCAGHARIVQYLIDSGADVNAADQDGWTPLHCAVTCDSLPLTKLLVGSGAVLYCTTHSDSETPFDLCHNGGPVEVWLRAEEDRLGPSVRRVRLLAGAGGRAGAGGGDQLTVVRKGDGAETAWWWCRREGDADAADGETAEEGYVARNFVSLYKSHG
uniref:ANK_REP_REGION domain-containing protein n=1 Tax=Macrostomum lignano TaxID=282301 RepID=A0A1I8FLZ2_9PLAT